MELGGIDDETYADAVKEIDALTDEELEPPNPFDDIEGEEEELDEEGNPIQKPKPNPAPAKPAPAKANGKPAQTNKSAAPR